MKKQLTVALLVMLTAGVAQAAERPMRILLVNDDGCDSPGTTSLQDKLTAKGYDVWMVAPATNQSGIGSAITFKANKIFDVKKSRKSVTVSREHLRTPWILASMGFLKTCPWIWLFPA